MARVMDIIKEARRVYDSVIGPIAEEHDRKNLEIQTTYDDNISQLWNEYRGDFQNIETSNMSCYAKYFVETVNSTEETESYIQEIAYAVKTYYWEVKRYRLIVPIEIRSFYNKAVVIIEKYLNDLVEERGKYMSNRTIDEAGFEYHNTIRRRIEEEGIELPVEEE